MIGNIVTLKGINRNRQGLDMCHGSEQTVKGDWTLEPRIKKEWWPNSRGFFGALL